jgi:hypothetical protein
MSIKIFTHLKAFPEYIYSFDLFDTELMRTILLILSILSAFKNNDFFMTRASKKIEELLKLYHFTPI